MARSKENAPCRAKLEREHEGHGRLVAIPERMQKSLGSGKMLIPRPMDVDAAMRRVRKGKLMTLSVLRSELARAAGANATCPLTTGIFARLSAEAAEEDLSLGKRRVTPYWRTIRDDGSLIDKFPGGVRAQARRLREEGFSITPSKGKKAPRVKDYETKVITL